MTENRISSLVSHRENSRWQIRLAQISRRRRNSQPQANQQAAAYQPAADESAEVYNQQGYGQQMNNGANQQGYSQQMNQQGAKAKSTGLRPADEPAGTGRSAG